MADIELNVEVRAKSGSGASRAVRREGKVPGVLYGGPRGPVPIAVNANAFAKSLYTGKLLGHLVTLRYGGETQKVIAKDVQFDPVSDRPLHFDLYRVDEHQLVKIAVPVQFRNQDVCPGLKKGGVLNVARQMLRCHGELDARVATHTVDSAVAGEENAQELGKVGSGPLPHAGWKPLGFRLLAHET